MRTFVAVALPETAQRVLHMRQQQLARQLCAYDLDGTIRWTEAENLHLTLRFLGEIDEAQHEQLTLRLAAIAAHYPRFEVRVGELGCFPNCRQPAVVWCGLQESSHTLDALQKEVEVAAQAAGLSPAEKQFIPHLTIGRAQRRRFSELAAAGQIIRQVAAAGSSTNQEMTEFIVAEILLMHSKQTNRGSIYRPLGVYPLLGRECPLVPQQAR